MKILAIDIGTAFIKSVVVETKFKRFDIVFHETLAVADAWEPLPSSAILLSPGQLGALAEIKRRHIPGVDRVVTNLPFSLYSSRFFSFPLKDKRKVLNAVKFAIEDEIPFDVDDCIITSHLFPAKGKETHVLTGFSQTQNLETFIDELSTIELPVDCLMMEESALSSQFLRSKTPPPKSFAVLNLGHRKSSMFFFRDGLPVLHRSTMTGGFDVTTAIANKYSMSIADADQTKLERAFLAIPGMNLNHDQEVFTETIRNALEPAFADFQQSLMAFTSRHNEPLDIVYLCGGTALIPGISEYLAKRWEKKIQPLQVTRLFPQISIQPQKNSECLIPIAAAMALSQVSGDTKSQINFRTGKLHATNRGLQLNFQQFIYPAKLAVIVYLVAMFSLIGQIFFLQKDFQRKEDSFNKAIQSVLGRVAGSYLVTLKSNPSRLRKAIQEKIDENQTQTKGSAQDSSSILHLVYDLSRSIPKSSVVEIKNLEYRPSQLTIKMESPTKSDAEKVIGILSKLPNFQSPKASPIEVNKTAKYSLTTKLSTKKVN